MAATAAAEQGPNAGLLLAKTRVLASKSDKQEERQWPRVRLLRTAGQERFERLQPSITMIRLLRRRASLPRRRRASGNKWPAQRMRAQPRQFVYRRAVARCANLADGS